MKQKSTDSFFLSWYGRFIGGFIFGVLSTLLFDFTFQQSQNVEALLIEAAVWGAITGGLAAIFGARFLAWLFDWWL
ncbi:MAG: hypothetical protein HOO88_07370 [Kiritimatiellaceae bacterium]|nr:hypothetical protein [Kiritimatiellaceae bacterium]